MVNFKCLKIFKQLKSIEKGSKISINIVKTFTLSIFPLQDGFLTFLHFSINVTLLQKNVKQLEQSNCMNSIVQFMPQILFLLHVRLDQGQMGSQIGPGMQKDIHFIDQFQSKSKIVYTVKQFQVKAHLTLEPLVQFSNQNKTNAMKQ